MLAQRCRKGHKSVYPIYLDFCRATYIKSVEMGSVILAETYSKIRYEGGLHREQADTGRDTRSKGFSEKLDRGITSFLYDGKWTILRPDWAQVESGRQYSPANRDGQGFHGPYALVRCGGQDDCGPDLGEYQ